MSLSFAQERKLVELFHKIETVRNTLVLEASASIFLPSRAVNPAERALRDLQYQLLAVLKSGELPKHEAPPLLVPPER